MPECLMAYRYVQLTTARATAAQQSAVRTCSAVSEPIASCMCAHANAL
jgi:hypothetical protein